MLEKQCGMKQLKTDSCMWIKQGPLRADGTRETVGMVAVHVDDFSIGGKSGCNPKGPGT